MRYLRVNEPISGGIFLTYRCTGRCKHCMYACSPEWNADWIDLKGAEKILEELSSGICSAPYRGISINYGLHFTGGEPFLNFDLLLNLAGVAKDHGILGTFVETNCFWCKDRQECRKKLVELKRAGLDGILISINPFTLEHVPFERAVMTIEESKSVFGPNVLVYQQSFDKQMRKLGACGTLSLEESLRFMNYSLEGLELLLRGRLPYELRNLYPNYPAEKFFGSSCDDELRGGWHIHVDNYFNYIPGYCGGISLGDARNLEEICSGINLDDRPILGALSVGLGELYRFASEEFGYEQNSEGYVSKCHLCVDIRRHIAKQTDEFEELSPREFYYQIESRNSTIEF